MGYSLSEPRFQAHHHAATECPTPARSDLATVTQDCPACGGKLWAANKPQRTVVTLDGLVRLQRVTLGRTRPVSSRPTLRLVREIPGETVHGQRRTSKGDVTLMEVAGIMIPFDGLAIGSLEQYRENHGLVGNKSR